MRRITTKRASVVLWSVQGLLALLFLFAGGMKLVAPIEMLKGPVALPGLFFRFIGICEVLGALGLVLPGLLRIRTGLTPLAAAGLGIIMSGATVITVAGGAVAGAFLPLAVGLLTASVAYGRWHTAPLPPTSGRLSISRPLVRRLSRA
jgi:DoxX-like protein